jgi:hypothetical protein
VHGLLLDRRLRRRTACVCVMNITHYM